MDHVAVEAVTVEAVSLETVSLEAVLSDFVIQPAPGLLGEAPGNRGR